MFPAHKINTFVKDLEGNLLDKAKTEYEGPYTKVYKLTIGEKPIIVKKFIPGQEDLLNKEVSIFELLGEHPQIIHYYDHSKLSNLIVLECAAKGGLMTLMICAFTDEELKKQYLAARPKYLVGFARAIAFLHSKRVLHRDLKADNLLIDVNDEIKLCDFGLSHPLGEGEVMYKSEPLGTVQYNAPEINKAIFTKNRKAEYTYASDIWSFCIALWTMYSLQNPFRDCRYANMSYDASKLNAALQKGVYPDDKLITDEPVRELALRMWNMKPELRPSAAEVVTVAEELKAKVSNTVT